MGEVFEYYLANGRARKRANQAVPSVRFTLIVWMAVAVSELVVGWVPDLRAADDGFVQAELVRLQRLVPTLEIIKLPRRAGKLALTTRQSLTIENLRGLDLDEAPPFRKLGASDDVRGRWARSGAPYVAQDIRPFRFKYFNCEFNYGGTNTADMKRYASTHGFNIIYYAKHPRVQGDPPGTRRLLWGGFIKWHRWMRRHHVARGHYHKLRKLDLVGMHVKAAVFNKAKGPTDLLMIDMEHEVLPPDKLRQQTWYPRRSAPSERQRFEQDYYEGFAQTHISAVEAARLTGWRDVAIYGWAPFPRTWWGLDRPLDGPVQRFEWKAYGRQIYAAVDAIHPSVYIPYWGPKSVAYTLENIDRNVAICQATGDPKPVRPYYWTQLAGGGKGRRWWRFQPIIGEEIRAATAMAFFAGCDGLVLWNSSASGANHHQVPALTDGWLRAVQRTSVGDKSDPRTLMLGSGFALRSRGARANTKKIVFRRYDVIHIVGVNQRQKITQFKKVNTANRSTRDYTNDSPIFEMPTAQLRMHVRPLSEPVAAVIEALALIKPLEYTLRFGKVRIDVPAWQQFKHAVPIVRRVKAGKIHILITYDPQAVYGGSPRQIVLKRFDGVSGRTLRLPADEKTRIFILRER